MISLRLSGVCVAFLVLTTGACGGKEEDVDDDLVVSDTESALSGVESADDEDERGDDGCRDGDHDGHRHHRRHWFRVLDILDGTRDRTITIASLPSGLPERLITRLQRIDKDDDGIVTKREARRALRRHRAAQDERGD